MKQVPNYARYLAAQQIKHGFRSSFTREWVIPFVGGLAILGGILAIFSLFGGN